MDWRPIETAPKDGTAVLLNLPEMGDVVSGAFCDGRWEDNGMAQCRFMGDPTHWMPLPEPPKDTQGDKG